MTSEDAERDPAPRDRPLPSGGSELRTRISGSASAPATARHLLRDLITPHADASEQLDTLMLLTSEVVTNAVNHPAVSPGSAIEMCVLVDSERTRVVVSDLGAGFERPADTRPPGAAEAQMPTTGGGGFGLLLLDKAASRWGTFVGADRFSVWFEIDHAREQYAVRC
jgi:anti-sigma regulatory factor (Ser/Thr protein kinase)